MRLMPRTHVDFLEDSDFEKAVKWVVDGYQENNNIKRNGIDPFKTVFDMYNKDMSFTSWKNAEGIRQNDKTVNNKVGEFHQKILGSIAGWKDLQTGDVADICNDSKTIFVELKNRWNTVKGSNMIDMWNHLNDIVENKHHGSTAYWGFINAKDGSSGEGIWTIQKKSNPKVKKIWGKNVYKMVTGDVDSLEKVWNALPKVLDKVLQKNTLLDESEKSNLVKWFQSGY